MSSVSAHEVHLKASSPPSLTFEHMDPNRTVLPLHAEVLHLTFEQLECVQLHMEVLVLN